ncbi:predicted protein [Naegleria gruberi]|uniref:Predicted protein n=1 Tax=Naegleria gruberi TaxID=5762 RepID=D2UZW9_NAEGR|nr:uncharacterized protein NAEGRDRAFT_62090 [Naegleria gruberi]EFC50006.1 predicted protein [Naegleria gruberi]|eukprot:XP_002682750.1 predicted protein [Naegleria gruberi strain NEG-M]
MSQRPKIDALKQLFRKLCYKINDTTLLVKFDTYENIKIGKSEEQLKELDIFGLYKTKTMKRNSTMMEASDHQQKTTPEVESTLPEPSPKKSKLIEEAIPHTSIELSSDQRKDILKLKKLIEKASNQKSINIQSILSILNSALCLKQMEMIFEELSIDNLNDGLLFHIIQGLFSKSGLTTNNNHIDTCDQCSSIIQHLIQPKLINMKQKASRHLFSSIQQVCCNQKFSNMIIELIILNLLREKSLSVDQIEIITRILDKIIDVEGKGYLFKLIIENISNKQIKWNEETTINILNRVMETKNLISKIDINLLEQLITEFEEIIPQYSKSLKFALLVSNFLTIVGQTHIIKSHYPSIKDIIGQLDNKMKENIEKKFENFQTK